MLQILRASASLKQRSLLAERQGQREFYKTFHRVDVYDTNRFDLVVDTGKNIFGNGV